MRGLTTVENCRIIKTEIIKKLSEAGQRHLFGDLLHRHTSILCEEGENLAVQIVHGKSTPFEICYIIQNFSKVKFYCCRNSTTRAKVSFRFAAFNYIKFWSKSKVLN